MNYVHISGGKDSTAMAILLHQQGIDFELVFADTGVEFPETYWMVSKIAKVFGRKLHIVSNGSFFEHLVARGYFLPGVKRRWCTQELKVTPLKSLCDRSGNTVFIGFRADESSRATSNKKLPWSCEVRYPLIEAGAEKKDVMQLCHKYDLLNPLYSWRSSVSCFCCPFQRKSDWLGLLRNYPQLYALAEQWEELAGRTWKDTYSQIALWPEGPEPCKICAV